MKQIPLTRSLSTIVDDEDADHISKFKWFAHRNKRNGNFYAARNATEGGKRVTIRLHRVLAGATSGQLVDHRNGDSLDNRRANLRVCSTAQNGQNRGIQRNNRSGFKGVCYFSHHKKWKAQIYCNGKYMHLGYFCSDREAAAAYDSACQNLHAEFAKPNGA